MNLNSLKSKIVINRTFWKTNEDFYWGCSCDCIQILLFERIYSSMLKGHSRLSKLALYWIEAIKSKINPFLTFETVLGWWPICQNRITACHHNRSCRTVYKHKQEKKFTLRYALFAWCWVFHHGKRGQRGHTASYFFSCFCLWDTTNFLAL